MSSLSIVSPMQINCAITNVLILVLCVSGLVVAGKKETKPWRRLSEVCAWVGSFSLITFVVIWEWTGITYVISLFNN